MPAKKTIKKPVGDVTSTARASTYLERLAGANGRRVVVDLAEPACEALEKLLANGFADTQKEAITKALLRAAKKY